MTIEQIAEYLGTDSVSSARSWCAKHGVVRTTLARTEDVVQKRLAQPGKTGRPRKITT